MQLDEILIFHTDQVKNYAFCLLHVKSLKCHDSISFSLNEDLSFNDMSEFLMEEFSSKERLVASYGNEQFYHFQKNVNNNPFSLNFLNIQTLFSIIFNVQNEVSSDKALELLQLSVPKANDLEDVVLNSALILKECLRGPIPIINSKSGRQKVYDI